MEVRARSEPKDLDACVRRCTVQSEGVDARLADALHPKPAASARCHAGPASRRGSGAGALRGDVAPLQGLCTFNPVPCVRQHD
eukprot:5760385-Prymnesium_polylepis.2